MARVPSPRIGQAKRLKILGLVKKKKKYQFLIKNIYYYYYIKIK